MSAEVKYRSDKGTEEERIARRLRNSAEGLNADTVRQDGASPLRTFHNIFHSANHQPLPFRKEEPEQ